MAQQAGLDVLGPQRFAQHRIVLEVDLPDGEIVRGAPVGVEAGEHAHSDTPAAGLMPVKE
jgi:hypothetical protein